MEGKRIFALSSLVAAMGLVGQPYAMAAEQTQQLQENGQPVENIKIVGARYHRVSEGATGLTMEIAETPQSISVLSNEQIANFGANDLNDALRLAPGVNVEEWETNRTNYSARGFEIKSTQIDGVGLPNDWGIVTGAMESYGYEEIEIIRGANGQLTGVGNSAGTINYVRKRPTNENEGEVGITYGTDNLKRIQADYSALLTDDGRWAGRVVVAAEDKESHLDGLEDDRTYFYGVVDGQLTDNALLTVGFSYQDANTDGNTWGGLVYNYSDGTQAEWDSSATTAQDWTMWDTVNTTAFVEYAYIFDNDWTLKLTYNHQRFEDESKLIYAYTVDGIDKDTGEGLYGLTGRYDTEFAANLLDINAIGDYRLFGRDHQLMLGLSGAQSSKQQYSYSSSNQYPVLPAFPYDLDAIEEPEWGDRTEYSDIDVLMLRAYGSTKFNLTDNLFTVIGFNAMKYNREGTNSGVEIDNDETEISPYAGIVYNVTDNINTYASYSDIYQPQEQYNYDGYFLDPTKGVNYEVGVKALWLNKRLMTSFALFSAEQQNLASYAGIKANGQYYYTGIDIESQGLEVEVNGRISDNWNAMFAYTLIDVEDENGNEANEWAARNVIKFNTDYSFTQMPTVAFGLGGKWQSETRNATYNVDQDAYLTLNAFARWDINQDLTMKVNINNLTDEKYISSLANVGSYAAPINGSVSLNYSF